MYQCVPSFVTDGRMDGRTERHRQMDRQADKRTNRRMDSKEKNVAYIVLVFNRDYKKLIEFGWKTVECSIHQIVSRFGINIIFNELYGVLRGKNGEGIIWFHYGVNVELHITVKRMSVLFNNLWLQKRFPKIESNFIGYFGFLQRPIVFFTLEYLILVFRIPPPLKLILKRSFIRYTPHFNFIKTHKRLFVYQQKINTFHNELTIESEQLLNIQLISIITWQFPVGKCVEMEFCVHLLHDPPSIAGFFFSCY